MFFHGLFTILTQPLYPMNVAGGVLESPGRIEYLNMAFHDERRIYPVGFCLRRNLAIPDGPSGPCLFEIKYADEGPLFSVSLGGK